MYNENQLLIKAADMYDKKQYRKLENFLNPLLYIYPENDELKKIAAFNYLELGNVLQSAEMISDISDKSIEENRTLEEIIKSLYDKGNYVDLLNFYDRKIMLKNVNTSFYYGVALYKKGRYEESYKALIYANKNTFMLPELSYYIGLNLDKKGKPTEAINYFKAAFEADRFNQSYKKSIIDAYRKTGLFKEAETILRNR